MQKKSNIYKILSLLEEEKASLINILRVIVGKKKTSLTDMAAKRMNLTSNQNYPHDSMRDF